MTMDFFELIHTTNIVQPDLRTELWIVDKDVRDLSKSRFVVEKVFHRLFREVSTSSFIYKRTNCSPSLFLICSLIKRFLAILDDARYNSEVYCL